MISLIIVAYKDRGWLDDTIESAKNQTFRDYEVILCSDGNPKLGVFAQKHNIDFILAEKKNWSHCFNLAVNHCSGDWIKWLDDDDLLTPNCLNDLYQGTGTADMVYANAINFDAVKEQLYKSPVGLSLKDFLPIVTNRLHGGTVLIKKTAFNEIGGMDENLFFAEEYDFYLNMLIKGKTFTHVDSTVVKYRKHADTNSERKTPEIEKQIKEYLIKKYHGRV
jgi:glycosyltransferase involved in cell wall biosynthesis